MSRLVTFVLSLGTFVGALFAPPAFARPSRPVSLDFRLAHISVIGDSYTTGTDQGGLGSKTWTGLAWKALASHGVRIAADVAAEGRAGYGVAGDHGSFFEDLTARVVKPEDTLVVFFGSRNDQDVDPGQLAGRAHDTFALARRFAPSAKFLVIGPPWPTADVPESVLRIRDALSGAARGAGAVFVDPIVDRWFVDKPELIAPDGVHPNDAGHEYMANNIAPIIRAQLYR